MQTQTGIEIIKKLFNCVRYELFERKAAILSLKAHLSIQIITIPEIMDLQSQHAKPLDSCFNLG
jgi:hypothetical protein